MFAGADHTLEFSAARRAKQGRLVQGFAISPSLFRLRRRRYYRQMPTISFFYGIIIRMYFRDHAPPHFHAVYGEHEALVSIETGDVIFGHLPRTAARIVKDWTVARTVELQENWARARKYEPLERIPGPEDE